MPFGKIKEFDVRAGNWARYVERLEMYFKVNEIKDDMQLPMLIAGIGDEAYDLLSNLSSPKKPAELTYKSVITLMQNHLQPEPSTMAERFRFRQRRQKVDESISQYVTDLKKLSRYCNFGHNLEENLRDQIVCGVKSEVTRQRLFAEDNLTYAGAVKLAHTLEAAERDAAAVDSVSASGAVDGGAQAAINAMTSARSRQPRREDRGTTSRADNMAAAAAAPATSCATCGRSGHVMDDCRYKHFICSKCNRTGHLRRVCPQRTGRMATGRRGGRVNHVEAEEEEESTEEDPAEVEEELYQLSLNGYKAV